MPDKARLIITGESTGGVGAFREALLQAGVSVDEQPNIAAVLAAHTEIPPPPGLIVACAEGPVFDDTLAEALSIKEKYPALPVIVYGKTIRDVLRLRCVEKGLDDCVTRDKLVSIVTFFANLLSTPVPASGPISTDNSTEQMFFQLSGDELSNALQFLCMSSREGRMGLTFESGDSGAVFIGDGTVTHAEIDGYEGITAIARMLRKGSMEARFFDGVKAPKITNTMSISGVLIEASVMADESNY